MSWKRVVFKSHKWLAVAALLPTLIWFLSGMLIALPLERLGALPVVRGPGGPGPAYEDVQVSVPLALAVATAVHGERVEASNVGMVRLDGRLLYQLRLRKRPPLLVDAMTGEPYVIDEARARDLLARGVNDSVPPHGTLVQRHDSSYAYGPLPVYRFDAGGVSQTTYFVRVEDGEIRRTTALGRVLQFAVVVHRFAPLRPLIGEPAVKALMVIMGLVATIMSAAGVVILWIQFVNWRRRRRLVVEGPSPATSVSTAPAP